MKKAISLLILLALATTSIYSQAVLKGKITRSGDYRDRLFLSVLNDFSKGFSTFDSIPLAPDGNFFYRLGNTDSNIVYRLLLPPAGGNSSSVQDGISDNFLLFTIHPGDTVHIQADADSVYYSAIIRTGAGQPFEPFKQLKRPLFHLAKKYIEQVRHNPDAAAAFKKAMAGEYLQTVEAYRNTIRNTIEQEQDGGLALLGLYYYYIACFGNYDTVFFQAQLPRLENQPYKLIEKLERKFRQLQQVENRFMIPGISLPDKNGVTFSLQNLKGELIVVDFWASWCSPCRAANRQDLPDLYRKLKANNMMLVGISVDATPANWHKAIRDDKTTWLQLIDQDGKLIADQMKIVAFPTYLVLNKAHEIIFTASNILELNNYISTCIKKGT